MDIESSNRQQEPGNRDGRVTFWEVVGDAIKDTAQTARLVAILISVLAVLGALAYLGVHVSL